MPGLVFTPSVPEYIQASEEHRIVLSSQTLDIGMRISLIILAACLLPAQAGAAADLGTHVWNPGSEDCVRSRAPAIEIFQADADSYILRQNKCVHVEAPFIYVLFGEHTVFVQDTGATTDPSLFSLYDAVQSLIAKRTPRTQTILVTHSHSHSDHTAGDAQFRGKPGVTLVEPNTKAVREHFAFTKWPEGRAEIDLGGRTLYVMPAPGHQDESVAVYDSRTRWLLTGDTVYPGRLTVKDWRAYRSSIERMVEFARSHDVSAVLGTHIEMSRSGTLFPPGSTFQQDEAPLALTVEDLRRLSDRLGQARDEPQEIAMAKFVVSPIGSFQRGLAGVLKFFGVR
jgi:hydroxyacylglutathione hydrolase